MVNEKIIDIVFRISIYRINFISITISTVLPNVSENRTSFASLRSK